MNPFGNLLEGLIEGAITGAIKGGVGMDPGAIARTASRQVSADPVVVNQTNQEPPLQSRVVVGSVIGMIGAMFVAGDHLWSMWQSGDVNVTIAIAELTTLWGLGFALYGRLKNGLKPLFAK